MHTISSSQKNSLLNGNIPADLSHDLASDISYMQTTTGRAMISIYDDAQSNTIMADVVELSELTSEEIDQITNEAECVVF